MLDVSTTDIGATGFAVLSVHTSNGVLVLDNLNRSIRPIGSVPYKIVAMQGGSSMSWRR
jgi:predicted transglutaminase-like cysteine proteinase